MPPIMLLVTGLALGGSSSAPSDSPQCLYMACHTIWGAIGSLMHWRGTGDALLTHPRTLRRHYRSLQAPLTSEHMRRISGYAAASLPMDAAASH